MKYDIKTAYNQDTIVLTHGWKDTGYDLLQQQTREIINLKDQAVQQALNKIGWLDPSQSTEIKIKAERYDWIKENIQEEVTQRSDDFVGVKTKYVLPYLHAYAEFTGQISFDEAVDIARGIYNENI